MCSEKITEHAINYVNGQLGLLHANAVDCVSTHGDNVPDVYRDRQYDFALAYFELGNKQRGSLRSRDSLFFSASFGVPQIKFVCNHEAILRLHLISGHYNTDIQAQEARELPRRDLHDIQNDDVLFRVSFDRRTLSECNCDTGASPKHINYLTFDLKNAVYVRSAIAQGRHNEFTAKSEVYDDREPILIHYLRKYYLPLLVKSGHNVLFSLPDFDDRRRLLQVDFCQQVLSENLFLDSLRGVSIKDINRYVANKWLHGALRLSDSVEVTLRNASHNRSFAEVHESAEEFRASVRFSAPELLVLCKKEVALVFNTEHLTFFTGDRHRDKHHFTNWKFAIVFDVLYDEDESGRLVRIRVDLTNPRPSVALSSFGQLVPKLWWLQTSFFDFIVDYYLIKLDRLGYDVIYEFEQRAISYPSYSGVDEKHGLAYTANDVVEEVYTSWIIDDYESSVDSREATYGKTWGYDHVTIISQRSLNARLRSLWESTTSKEVSDRFLRRDLLINWAFTLDPNNNFGADFGVPQIRLYTNGETKADVILHLQKGFVQNLPAVGETSHRHEFSNWYLVFEADVKTRTSKETLVSSDVYEAHARKGDRTVHEVYLDLENSRFKIDECRLSSNRVSVQVRKSKALALSQYIRTNYFAALQQQHHNVLASFPVFAYDSSNAGTVGVTDYRLWIHRNPSVHQGADTFLVVPGMCNGHRLLPLPSEKTVIAPRDGKVFGSVVLSRQVFLEALLLERLSRVNAVTAVIPAFAGVVDDKWKVVLTTWAKDEYKKQSNTKWQLKSKDSTALVYEWRVRDEWTYAHDSQQQDISNGSYIISCRTTNALHVPLTSKLGDSNIAASGEVELKLSYSSNTTSWSSLSVARWSTTISLALDSNGKLRIHSGTKTIVPTFDALRVQGDRSHPTFTDASVLLEGQLRNCVDLEAVVSGIVDEFHDRWPYFFAGYDACGVSNAQFNEDGDLLLALSPYSYEFVVPTIANRPKHSESKQANGDLVTSSSYQSIRSF